MTPPGFGLVLYKPHFGGVSHLAQTQHRLSQALLRPASGVLPVVVDPGLNGSCAERWFLCCHNQCLCLRLSGTYRAVV